jgi:hypothetical protein
MGQIVRGNVLANVPSNCRCKQNIYHILEFMNLVVEELMIQWSFILIYDEMRSRNSCIMQFQLHCLFFNLKIWSWKSRDTRVQKYDAIFNSCDVITIFPIDFVERQKRWGTKENWEDFAFASFAHHNFSYNFWLHSGKDNPAQNFNS